MSEQQKQENWYDEELSTEELEREQEIRRKRAQRIQEMKKEKERCILVQKCIKIGVPIVAVIFIAVIILVSGRKSTETENFTAQQEEITQLAQAASKQEEINSNEENQEIQNEVGNQEEVEGTTLQNELEQTVVQKEVGTEGTVVQEEVSVFSAKVTNDTLALTDEIISTNAILIDLESDTVIARKSMKEVISPASMTKVLTVLVAAEQIEKEQLDDKFTMTLEITDYAYVNDCSSVGFLDGEIITVRDLFYGTILPSGGDAAVGLATYVAGSHEAFVELMNNKIEELGLSDTAHMTNCVGLYDENHHCTVYDMAMIMEAAMENELCREVMNAHTYTTSATEQHPEGIIISNWFLRRIEDKDTGGEVLCAKTGYVVQSGNCAVSYGKDYGGKEYLCVTANATSSWKCIYDHVALYKMYATGTKEETGTQEQMEAVGN